MSFSFKTILIPVDFTLNSEIAIEKAIQLADPKSSVFHLLHVETKHRIYNNPELPGPVNHQDQQTLFDDRIKKLLNTWRDKSETQHFTDRMFYHVSNAHSITQAIEKKAAELKADLIVISKTKCHIWLPFVHNIKPGKIARETGTRVLTLKPGARNHTIKNIIVPVNMAASFEKMSAIAALHSRFRFKIHLVTFLNDRKKPDDFSSSTLVHSFRWIKENIRCPVEYTVLHGNNKAKALLHYAEITGADLMLIDTAIEPGTGWLKQQMPDLIPAASKIQLLMFPSVS